MRTYTLILSFLMSTTVIAQPFMKTPIEGVIGKDYTIVNYVDWNENGMQDPFCGTKTYDGHEGTDYVIRSFAHMDSGVYVLAVASGRVTAVQDGLFDRETVSDVSKGLGNLVAIKHSNGYTTYYAHLKKNSISVQVGDSVISGQRIAKVGSSGNSTDPHLHFEVYFNGTTLVDPFKGICGNQNSLWLNQQAYDTSFKVWDYGMHKKKIEINDLRERKQTMSCCPFTFKNNSDDSVVVWSHMYGLKKGKTLTVNWYSPAGIIWFTYDFKMEQDWWYYYFNTFINNKDLPLGSWRVELVYDGNIALSQPFEVTSHVGIDEVEISNECQHYRLLSNKELDDLIHKNSVQLYDAKGSKIIGNRQSLNTIEIKNLQPGVYYLAFTSKTGTTCYAKRFVE